LAHFSDIHISDVKATLARMWTSKRILGGANMLLFRRKQLRNHYLPLFVKHVQQQGYDQVAVTGDLTTTALDVEFRIAKTMLQPLIDDQLLTTIPGNHDVYTPSSAREQRYERYFAECHGHSQGEGQTGVPGPVVYPFVRPVGEDVVLIGVNTCVPTGAFQAWGVVDALQLERLGHVLAEHKDKTRVVLMHHFLEDHKGHPGEPSRWIQNRSDVLDVFKRHGAELILHGHKHACYHYTVPGPDKDIPVYNPAPTTWHHLEPAMQGGYQVYELDKGGLQRATRFRFDPASQSFSEPILLWEQG
jgi:3',5'-cyclic AMP phosphodiesterase CpdA